MLDINAVTVVFVIGTVIFFISFQYQAQFPTSSSLRFSFQKMCRGPSNKNFPIIFFTQKKKRKKREKKNVSNYLKRKSTPVMIKKNGNCIQIVSKLRDLYFSIILYKDAYLQSPIYQKYQSIQSLLYLLFVVKVLFHRDCQQQNQLNFYVHLINIH